MTNEELEISGYGKLSDEAIVDEAVIEAFKAGLAYGLAEMASLISTLYGKA